uniref:Uncharacterized protein n=1 Tax=Poecilia formosa TaxID=48698 RepID=A0A096M622_POEFO
NQDQSQKENLQPGDDTETLDENISLTDKEGKLVHMPTESEPEVRNPEKREINESEKLNPPEDRLQRGRERQTERLSQDEIKYPQDITMEDVEEQERQKNLFEHQVLPEDRTDEEMRKNETENSNRLITASEEAGAADESENNKPLPAENINYNHNQAENAALNKLEENEEIGEEASHVKENLPAQDNDKISQSLLSPDENQLDDKHQRRNEMTVDVSKTQKQETEDVDETHFHKDRPKLDDGEESKQKSQKTGRRKRNRSEQGKKENQDHTDRRGDDQMAAYSDSPAQPYLDEAAEVIKKKHTKQKVQTSHDAQNELDLKKTNQAENAALNKLEENEEIGEEASHVKENLPAQDNDKIPQSLLSPDENQLDDKHQRRNEMTVDDSKTQKQETKDVDETHFHKDRPKLDDVEESKQKSQKTGKRKRNRSEQGKKENQDHTDRRGDDQMAAYSDSPAQPYLDEAAEVIKKKHTKQKVQTSHDAQNELDLK